MGRRRILGVGNCVIGRIRMIVRGGSIYWENWYFACGNAIGS